MTLADLENAVERAIAFLDALDGDSDLEPSLGVYWAEGRWQTDDCEDQCEGEGEACEDEGAVTGDDEPEQGE